MEERIGCKFTEWATSSVVERVSDPALKFWACSSVVERHSDKMEVAGSIPAMPTKIQNLVRGKCRRGRKPAP